MNEHDVIESIRSMDPLDDHDARIDADRAMVTARRRGRGVIAASVAAVVVVAAGGSVFAVTRPTSVPQPSAATAASTSVEPTPSSSSSAQERQRMGLGFVGCRPIFIGITGVPPAGDSTPLTALPVIARARVGESVLVRAQVVGTTGGAAYAATAVVTTPGTTTQVRDGDRFLDVGFPTSAIVGQGPVLHNLFAHGQSLAFRFTATHPGHYPVYGMTKERGGRSYRDCSAPFRQVDTSQEPWEQHSIGQIVIN